jgi:S-adenosylmethionine uptake transporter
VTNIKTSPLPAILACTLGIFLLSAMDGAVKGLVVVIGAYNTLLWRSVFASLTAGTAWSIAGAARPDTKVIKLHALRGVVVGFVALAFFWGLGRLPLAEAIALSFIAPLVALVLAAVLLGERIGRSAIWASVAGLAGVIVIMLGKFSTTGYAPGVFQGMAAIIASAILYAYNLILARRQALLAKPLEIVFFQNLVVGIVLGLAAPWLGMLLPADQWLPLAGVTALALLRPSLDELVLRPRRGAISHPDRVHRLRLGDHPRLDLLRGIGRLVDARRRGPDHRRVPDRRAREAEAGRADRGRGGVIALPCYHREQR